MFIFATLLFLHQAVAGEIADKNNTSVPIFVGNSTSCGNASERDLRIALFQNYSHHDRPRKNPSEPVTVSLGLGLEAIKDVAIKAQQITFSGFINVDWNDSYFSWANYPEFACISKLVIPADKVWLPDIALMNAPEKYALIEAPGEKVRIYNEGWVHFRPGGLFSAVCEFDLTYFPYDEQTCSLRFQSWMHSHDVLAIKLDSKNPIFQSRWTENEEWELINMSGAPLATFYSNSNHRYDGAVFTLVLRRRVGFFVMNIIIPGTIISTVEIVTFALDSGEAIKIHISFTCLLAFQVFQLMVIPELPQTSLHTPLLSIYIVLEMAYIGLALLGQGGVFLMLHRSEKRKSPPVALFMFAKTMARCVKVKIPPEKPDLEMIPVDKYPNEEESQRQAVSGIIRETLNKVASPEWDDTNRNKRNGHVSHTAAHFNNLRAKWHGNDKRKYTIEINRKRWAFTIAVIDRCVVFIYLTCVVLTPLILFLIIPAANSGVVRTLM